MKENNVIKLMKQKNNFSKASVFEKLKLKKKNGKVKINMLMPICIKDRKFGTGKAFSGWTFMYKSGNK
jgi:hypothetical protein